MRPLPIVPILALLFGLAAAHAAVHDAEPRLYEHLERERSGGRIGVRPVVLDELPDGDPLVDSWTAGEQESGPWKVWIDERSGMPALAFAPDVAWPEQTSIERHEATGRRFLEKAAFAAGPRPEHTFLDREASGRRGRFVPLVERGL